MPRRNVLPVCGSFCACVRRRKSDDDDNSLPIKNINSRQNSHTNQDNQFDDKMSESTVCARVSLPDNPLPLALEPPVDSSDEEDLVPELPHKFHSRNRGSSPNSLGANPDIPLTSALATSRRGSLYIFRHSDEVIVTPFAQVLHTLRSVYENVKTLTGADYTPNHKDSSLGGKKSNKHGATNSTDEEDYTQLADHTLRDLEWCLDQLETIQTHRSVADMASSKFKKLLNLELERMSSSGPSNNPVNASMANQIEKYIKTTFLDKDDDADNMSGPQKVEENDSKEVAREANGAQKTMTKVPVKSLQPGALAELDSPDLVPPVGVDTPYGDELVSLFHSEISLWGIDIFQVSDLSNQRPLTSVVYSIFERRDFLGKFRINPCTLVNYFSRIEDHYKKENPYHNAIHAADVTQSTHVLLNAAALRNVFTELELLAAIFACAVHDVNHPGVTNQFLINTENELAIMYNDMSVLENHHCAVAFKLLQEPNCNIFAELDEVQKKHLRKMVIDMVLATDMSKHMSLLADLKTMVETKKVAGGCLLKLDNYSEKIQIMQNMVHCADLSNPAKPLHLYEQWNVRVMEEFFNQGDREKALGLPVSPMCCRESANIEKSQVSFIDFIVHPLWEAWTELVHPDAEAILNTLEANRDYYADLSFAKESETAEKKS